MEQIFFSLNSANSVKHLGKTPLKQFKFIGYNLKDLCLQKRVLHGTDDVDYPGICAPWGGTWVEVRVLLLWWQGNVSQSCSVWICSERGEGKLHCSHLNPSDDKKDSVYMKRHMQLDVTNAFISNPLPQDLFSLYSRVHSHTPILAPGCRHV